MFVVGICCLILKYFSVYLSLKLTSEKKVDKHLLPPKKIIGKNSKSLVEKRQKELEVYLQTLLARFPVAAPKVLSCFLQFHAYVSYCFSLLMATDGLFWKVSHLFQSWILWCCLMNFEKQAWGKDLYVAVYLTVYVSVCTGNKWNRCSPGRGAFSQRYTQELLP